MSLFHNMGSAFLVVLSPLKTSKREGSERGEDGLECKENSTKIIKERKRSKTIKSIMDK